MTVLHGTTNACAYEWLMPLAPWEPQERLLGLLPSNMACSAIKCRWTRRLIVSSYGALSDQLVFGVSVRLGLEIDRPCCITRFLFWESQ